MNDDNLRRKSVRLKEYDYSQNGLYFVTLCVHMMETLFGQIANNLMNLNQYGIIVEQEWKNTFTLRRYAKGHDYVVMPNHFHGIVEITNDVTNFVEAGARSIQESAEVPSSPHASPVGAGPSISASSVGAGHALPYYKK